MTNSYCVISAVRNEEKYIELTLKSVIPQTCRPLEWIIVNDGSTDRTAEIVKKYQVENPWIKLVNKENRGYTEVGRGVIESFNLGFKNISNHSWDYIVKLDCDLSFENFFFEKLFSVFKDNKSLGISGGTTYVVEKDVLVEEKVPDFHPMAAARVYRKECFTAIGGLCETLGWDTIDLLRAQMKGWQTVRYKDLKIIHLRRMSSRKGLWEGKFRTGRNFYITGYHPLFLIARSLYRLFEKPYFVESMGVICGYFSAMIRRESLVVSEEEKDSFRKQQMRRLFGSKC